MRGQFNYLSWNIKQLSDRIKQSVGMRTTSTAAKKKYAIYTMADTTPLARLHARILSERVADVCAVMEGVKNFTSVSAAVATIQSNFAAVDVHKDALDFFISAPSGPRRADRYIVFVRQRTMIPNLNPSGAFFVTPVDCGLTYKSAALKYEDRYPVRFFVTERISGQQICCFLWHAPQPAYTQGANTISQLADFITDSESDTTISATHVVVSGDFNVSTAVFSNFAPLTTRTQAFASQLRGQLTTMCKSAASKFGAGDVGDQLIAGNFDAALSNDYDDVLLSSTTLTGVGPVTLNLAFWALEYIKERNRITLKVVTRALAENSMNLGNEISDHIPVGVTVGIP